MRRSARVFESDRLLATAVSGEICRYGGSEIDAKKPNSLATLATDIPAPVHPVSHTFCVEYVELS